MARIFYRQYAHPFWDRDALEGPIKGLTLREWEVCVILCSQDQRVARALRVWLIAPTDRQRWPWPDTFSSRRSPLSAGDVSGSLATVLDLFYKEISAIRQTLDMPFEAFGGINRDVLLAMHGQRLRWLVRGLGWKRALREVARLTQPGDAARSA